MLEPSKYGGGPTSLICGKKKKCELWNLSII
jgi:hypothetical protein